MLKMLRDSPLKEGKRSMIVISAFILGFSVALLLLFFLMSTNDYSFACKSGAVLLSSSSSSHPYFRNVIPPMMRREKYSSHVCFGGLDPEIFFGIIPDHFDWKRRVCIFSDLVWNGSNLVYHFDPSGGSVWSSPPHLKEEVRIPDASALAMFSNKIIATSDAKIDMTSDVIKQPAWLFLGSCYANFGHQLGDCIWPFFWGMNNARMLDPNNIILVSTVRNDNQGHFDIRNRHLRLLSRKPMMFLPEVPPGTRFSHVVVGTGPYSLKSKSLHYPRDSVLFRDFLYHVQGISINAKRDEPPLIVIRTKEERHRILNYEEIAEQLRAKFPQANVVVVNPAFFKSNITEEISLFSKTKIFITPSGGGSFGGIYMPDNSALILANFCWPCNASGLNRLINTGSSAYVAQGSDVCCGKTESYIWDNVPFLTVRYIGMPARKDLIFDATSSHKMFPWTDYSFPLDPQRVVSLVEEILLSE